MMKAGKKCACEHTHGFAVNFVPIHCSNNHLLLFIFSDLNW